MEFDDFIVYENKSVILSNFILNDVFPIKIVLLYVRSMTEICQNLLLNGTVNVSVNVSLIQCKEIIVRVAILKICFTFKLCCVFIRKREGN